MKEISKSELEIMQFLWKNGESTSVDIVKNVGQKIDWKNNTIMTLVSRLVTKGFAKSKKLTKKDLKNLMKIIDD